ncbi:MAG: hypothetical protein JWM57_308 [Phycisphaerales bacterium]|nr:hypothetical protein [Phycisphaerales bacterium]
MNVIVAESETERPAFWPAVPAVIAILLCVGLTAAVVWTGAEPSVATLQAKAAAAVARHDDRTAVLYYRHLLALEPAQPAHALKLALAIDRIGRRDEAIAVLTAVAPVAGSGFGPAHLQLADWLVSGLVLGSKGDRAGWDIARRHAKAAQNDPASQAAATALLEIVDGAGR